ncbi:MAG TPA: hypothetical protein GXZ86_07690 [Clostridiales bacterium]|jgi:hypothetical protein|nr:hypothetical protein [Clostridiales bacterium]
MGKAHRVGNGLRPDDHAGWSATLMAARDNPFVDFLHWELTPAHVIYDVCDGYATHDEGMGPGNYSLDNAPLPHPWCTCLWYPDTHKTLDDIGRELKGWLNGESNPRLDAAFGEWDRELEGEGNSARLVTPKTVAALGGPGSEDVSEEYRLSAKPGVGEIIFQEGYDKEMHQREIKIAKWLLAEFGGKIELRKEIRDQYVRTSDYYWNGKPWELKTIGSEAAVNSALRKGLKQLRGVDGGIVIYCDFELPDIEKLFKLIRLRMWWGRKQQTDVMVVVDDKTLTILRYKKTADD